MPSIQSGPEPTAEPEVVPEGEPEVVPEGEPTAYPESYSSVYSHPEPTGEPAGEPTLSAGAGVAEPVPDWSVAIPEWGEAWPFHIYGLGALFTSLALLSLVLLVLVLKRKLYATRMVSPILSLLILLGSTRAIVLFGDAYSWRSHYPIIFIQVMYGLTLPCLTSAYGLLTYSILQALHHTYSWTGRKMLWKFSAAIALHFTVTIVSDVIIGVNHRTETGKYLVFFCQCIFIFWGLCLFILFSWTGWALHQQLQQGSRLVANHSTHSRSATRELVIATTQIIAPPVVRWKRYSRPIFIIAMATVCGVCVMAVYIYGLVAVYDVFSSDGAFPEPWPWWSYQTTARVLELFMSYLILYATVLTPDNQAVLKKSIVKQPQASLYRSTNSDSTRKGQSLCSYQLATLNESSREICPEDEKIMPLVEIETSSSSSSSPSSAPSSSNSTSHSPSSRRVKCEQAAVRADSVATTLDLTIGGSVDEMDLADEIGMESSQV